MFSIDQNCHSLWDALPKLQALARHGFQTRHFIEDVDVAFAAIGADAQTPLHFAMERYFGSGGADWGAALFYSGFLGRLPVDVRHWEPYIGLSTAALARRLDLTVDTVYDRYSPGDNWQLIGPSYTADPQFHRLIGDLSVAELTDHLHELLDLAERDMLARFPADDAQQRLRPWLTAERERLEKLLAARAGGTLVDLYHDWLGIYLDEQPAVQIDLTSNLLALGADPAATDLLNLFVERYDEASVLYNEAMADSHTGLHGLDTQAGELPFFAMLRHDGHYVRAEIFLDSSAVRLADRTFDLDGGRLPLQAMRDAGVDCLAGKAALLILQARVCNGGAGLALPYRGSSYIPAAHALQRRLTAAGLLPHPIGPLMRVRFGLLDHMAGAKTIIALPDHLARAFGCADMPAARFAAEWRDLSRDAAGRLDAFKSDEGRISWQRHTMATSLEQVELLNGRRRDLAKIDPKGPEIRELSHQARRLETDIISATLEQIASDYQVANVDFWDSRGALYPWCIALGGEGFYDELIARADIYEESPEDH